MEDVPRPVPVSVVDDDNYRLSAVHENSHEDSIRHVATARVERVSQPEDETVIFVDTTSQCSPAGRHVRLVPSGTDASRLSRSAPVVTGAGSGDAARSHWPRARISLSTTGSSDLTRRLARRLREGARPGSITAWANTIVKGSSSGSRPRLHNLSSRALVSPGALENVRERARTVHASSLHQATVFFCLGKEAALYPTSRERPLHRGPWSRAGRFAFLLATLLLVVLQTVAIVGFIASLSWGRCTSHSHCSRGFYCSRVWGDPAYAAAPAAAAPAAAAPAAAAPAAAAPTAVSDASGSSFPLGEGSHVRASSQWVAQCQQCGTLDIEPRAARFTLAQGMFDEICLAYSQQCLVRAVRGAFEPSRWLDPS